MKTKFYFSKVEAFIINLFNIFKPLSYNSNFLEICALKLGTKFKNRKVQKSLNSLTI